MAFTMPTPTRGAVVALMSWLGSVAVALADHGGATRAAPMSPVLVGALAGAIALGVGVVVLVVARLVVKKTPPS